MLYRPEIDGLRAVAIIPVIMFHAGFEIFSGGFIGVDIFFVISGYLITSIIVSELERGTFSIANFYERRARRILPALFFVLLCCIPFAWLWMLPFQFKDFSQSLIAATVFASNLLFGIEDGYFDGPSEVKPLLHTWSLAVEEQYYLLFPLLLLMFWRVGRAVVFWLVVSIAAASLIANELLLRSGTTSNIVIFYLSPLRAWELLAGAICAFLMSGNRSRSNDWLALAGLLMIAFAIVAFDHATPFPSLYALMPVLGASLIILFGGYGTWTARFLSMPFFVGIGLISYSLYLWHQPLFAFARLRSTYEPSPTLMIALAAISLILAYLTWRFVELPFRRRPVPLLPRKSGILVASGFVATAFVGIGLYGHVEDGRNHNWSYYVAGYDDGHPCTFDGIGKGDRLQACLQAIGNRKRFVLVGDSHAFAFASKLRERLAKQDMALISFTKRSCFPVPQTLRSGRQPSHPCSHFKDEVYAASLALHPRAIIVMARWTLTLEGTRYINPYGYSEKGGPVETRLIGDNTNWSDARKRLVERTAEFFKSLSKKAPIVLLSQVPEASWSVPEVALNGDLSLLSYDYAAYVARNRRTNLLLSQLDAQVRIDVFDSSKVFCPPAKSRKCFQRLNGRLLYNDDNHMSPAGAALLADSLLPQLLSIAKSSRP